MRSRVLGAATFFLSLQLLAAASAYAQGSQPPTPPKARPPFSGVAHNVITWFHHVTGTGAHRQRIVSSPPLPRPRPAQLTKTPAELPAAALEQNKTPAVEPNEAQPAAAAAEPNKMSPAPASSVEPDKAPAVEPNEAQPAASAVEPNKVSGAPDATVEPDKPPKVELNEAQPAASAVEPNKMSPAAPDTTIEPDTPPTVELNEVQPAAAAAESNKISPAPALSVEPDKAPAELPAAAVEQNEAPPRTSAGAVLRGPDIPD